MFGLGACADKELGTRRLSGSDRVSPGGDDHSCSLPPSEQAKLLKETTGLAAGLFEEEFPPDFAPSDSDTDRASSGRSMASPAAVSGGEGSVSPSSTRGSVRTPTSSDEESDDSSGSRRYEETKTFGSAASDELRAAFRRVRHGSMARPTTEVRRSIYGSSIRTGETGSPPELMRARPRTDSEVEVRPVAAKPPTGLHSVDMSYTAFPDLALPEPPDLLAFSMPEASPVQLPGPFELAGKTAASFASAPVASRVELPELELAPEKPVPVRPAIPELGLSVRPLSHPEILDTPALDLPVSPGVIGVTEHGLEKMPDIPGFAMPAMSVELPEDPKTEMLSSIGNLLIVHTQSTVSSKDRMEMTFLRGVKAFVRGVQDRLNKTEPGLASKVLRSVAERKGLHTERADLVATAQDLTANKAELERVIQQMVNNAKNELEKQCAKLRRSGRPDAEDQIRSLTQRTMDALEPEVESLWANGMGGLELRAETESAELSVECSEIEGAARGELRDIHERSQELKAKAEAAMQAVIDLAQSEHAELATAYRDEAVSIRGGASDRAESFISETKARMAEIRAAANTQISALEAEALKQARRSDSATSKFEQLASLDSQIAAVEREAQEGVEQLNTQIAALVEQEALISSEASSGLSDLHLHATHTLTSLRETEASILSEMSGLEREIGDQNQYTLQTRESVAVTRESLSFLEDFCLLRQQITQLDSQPITITQMQEMLVTKQGEFAEYKSGLEPHYSSAPDAQSLLGLYLEKAASASSEELAALQPHIDYVQEVVRQEQNVATSLAVEARREEVPDLEIAFKARFAGDPETALKRTQGHVVALDDYIGSSLVSRRDMLSQKSADLQHRLEDVRSQISETSSSYSAQASAVKAEADTKIQAIQASRVALEQEAAQLVSTSTSDLGSLQAKAEVLKQSLLADSADTGLVSSVQDSMQEVASQAQIAQQQLQDELDAKLAQLKLETDAQLQELESKNTGLVSALESRAIARMDSIAADANAELMVLDEESSHVVESAKRDASAAISAKTKSFAAQVEAVKQRLADLEGDVAELDMALAEYDGLESTLQELFASDQEPRTTENPVIDSFIDFMHHMASKSIYKPKADGRAYQVGTVDFDDEDRERYTQLRGHVLERGRATEDVTQAVSYLKQDPKTRGLIARGDARSTVLNALMHNLAATGSREALELADSFLGGHFGWDTPVLG
jgi:hypothetical protein